MTDAKISRVSTQAFEQVDSDAQISRVSTHVFTQSDGDAQISRVSIQAFVVTGTTPTFAMRAGMVPL